MAATLPLVVLVAVFGWIHRNDLALDASTKSLIAGDQRSRALLDQVGEVLPRETPVGVIIEFASPERLYCDAGNHILAGICYELSRIRGCTEVKSVTETGYPKIKFEKVFGVQVPKPILPPFFPDTWHYPEEQWTALREELMAHPMCRNIFLSADGALAMAIPMFDRPMETWTQKRALRDHIKAVLRPFEEDVKSMTLIGFPTAELEVVESIAADARKFFIAFFLIASAVILLTFRSVPILFLILVYQILGLFSLGLVFAINGHSVNVYSLILVPLIAGLQLTFLTHFFSAVQGAVHEGDARPTPPIRAGLAEVLRPSFIAALTTAIGLLALKACNVEMVQHFGFLGAQAVMVLFLVTFGPPLVAQWWESRRTASSTTGPTDPNTEAPEATPVTAPAKSFWVPRFLPWLARRPLIGLGLAALALAVSVPAAFRLTTDMRAVQMLNPGSETRRAFGMINERMGGSFVFQVYLNTEEKEGIQQPEALAYMESLRERAKAIPGVSDAYAYSQIFTALNQQLMDEPKNFETLPTGGRFLVCRQILNALGTGLLGIDQLRNEDGTRASFYLRTGDMPATEYLDIVDRFITDAEEGRPDGLTVNAKAGLHTILKADRDIVRSQVNTLWISAGLMFLALALLWCSPWLGALALIANIPALAAMLGIMGATAIALNSVTVMVGAIILGIAVDDAVHFLDFYKTARSRAPDARTAVRETLAHKFKPMACTTAILLSCFVLFLFSSFPPVVHFGILAGTALLVAFAGALILLPALLSSVEAFGKR